MLTNTSVILVSQLFSGIRRTDQYYMNDDAHFESFPIAFITLFRCITGENWNGIMWVEGIVAGLLTLHHIHSLTRAALSRYALTIQPPFCIATGPDANCGWSLAVVAVYWIAFFILIPVIFCSLLSAVILDAYDESREPTALTHVVSREPTTSG